MQIQTQSSYRFPYKEYRIKHLTRYHYESPVSLSYHNLHLKPKDWPAIQHVSDFEIKVSLLPIDFTERQDFFGNATQSFSIQEIHDQLSIETNFNARVITNPPPVEDMTISCAQVRKSLHADTSERTLQALQYIYPSPHIPFSSKIEAWAKPFFPEKRPFIQCVLDLSSAIKNMITFDPEATEINTSVDQFFDLKKGVCQDYSHLMISCLRSLDLPIRYVSGYILTLPPEGEEKLEGTDASHAWISVYVPGYGWIDIDPTNDLIVGDQHIRIAIGRDFSDVSLAKGSVTGGGNSSIQVEVSVFPLDTTNNISQFQAQC